MELKLAGSGEGKRWMKKTKSMWVKEAEFAFEVLFVVLSEPQQTADLRSTSQYR